MFEINKGDRYRRWIGNSSTLWEVISLGPNYLTLRKISSDGTVAASLVGRSTISGRALVLNISTEMLNEMMERVEDHGSE